MTEADDPKKKIRARIERDVYSVLLSFQEGATPNQVERRMDDTLGYTYVGKYVQAGVRDMAQLLREHKDVRQNLSGVFSVVANEDNQDLINLISKQKKKKKGGKGAKPIRAATSMGFHNKSGFGYAAHLRSPKPSFMYPASSARANPAKPQATGYRNTVRHPPVRPSTATGHSSFANRSAYSHHTTRSTTVGPVKIAPSATAQRPLLRQPVTVVQRLSSTVAVPVLQPGIDSKCMPSIVDFSNNVKRMMLLEYPADVHLSELTEIYDKHFDVSIDPLQLFSKSWMMFVKTSFKEWLQLGTDGRVEVKEPWFTNFGAALKKSMPPAPEKKKPTTLHEPTSSVASSSLPISQGFRYQIPVVRPIVSVAESMKGLTVSARSVMGTPKDLPGVSNPIKNTARGSNKPRNDLASSKASKDLVVPVMKTTCIKSLEDTSTSSSNPSTLQLSTASTSATDQKLPKMSFGRQIEKGSSIPGRHISLALTEIKNQKVIAASIVGKSAKTSTKVPSTTRSVVLPPMSKGPGLARSRNFSPQQSTTSSIDNECLEAINAALPSDKDSW